MPMVEPITALAMKLPRSSIGTHLIRSLLQIFYRVAPLVGELIWVDTDFSCFTSCQISLTVVKFSIWGKIVEHHRPESTQTTQRTRWTTCCCDWPGRHDVSGGEGGALEHSLQDPQGHERCRVPSFRKGFSNFTQIRWLPAVHLLKSKNVKMKKQYKNSESCHNYAVCWTEKNLEDMARCNILVYFGLLFFDMSTQPVFS